MTPWDRRHAAALYRPVLALIAVALAGCADLAEPQTAPERADARLRVLADAAFYWKCTHQGVQLAGGCRVWREAYERDYAVLHGRVRRTLGPIIMCLSRAVVCIVWRTESG